MTRKPRQSRRTSDRRSRGKRAPDRDRLHEFIEHGTRSLNLKIDPSWLPPIAENRRVILSHAGNVEDFDLPDEAEPAPVFEP